MSSVFVVMERAVRGDDDTATETPWSFPTRPEAQAECDRLNAAKSEEHPGYFVQEKPE